MHNLRILIIIPAYNEQNSIEAVISNIHNSLPDADIIVIDDCSEDNTYQKAKDVEVAVIRLSFNLGIGGAMQTGYIYAQEHHYDVAIQVDGDGQHDAQYIRNVLDPVITGKWDMCIGSRYIESTEYKSSFFRRVGMIFFSVLLKLLLNKKVTDPTSGFRAVNKDIIKYFAKWYPVDYPEVEALISLHKKGFNFVETPVKMKNRENGSSSITPLKSIYYMVKVSLAIVISAMHARKLDNI